MCDRDVEVENGRCAGRVKATKELKEMEEVKNTPR